MAKIEFSDYIAGSLADERKGFDSETLKRGLAYAPSSARLHARVARAEMLGADWNVEETENHALIASRRSPWDYNNRLLLASIRESRGDRAGAELAARDALALAPNNAEVNWYLANVLLREGKSEALPALRAAATLNPAYFRMAMDTLWRASGGNPRVLEAAVPDTVESKLDLIGFFLSHDTADEAASVFASIDPRVARTLKGTPDFLNGLIEKGRYETARELWHQVKAGDSSVGDGSLVSNGGFETDLEAGLSQFDWSLQDSQFARITIDPDVAHGGSRSLSVEFLGRDTTRLDGEIRQLTLVEPGKRYRLEFYCRTSGLETTEPAQVVVEDRSTRSVVGASDAIALGSSDWRRYAAEFTAPPNVHAVYLTVRRVPQFSYDKPSRGRIWIDDLAITEAGAAK
jgi:hypothetical protein